MVSEGTRDAVVDAIRRTGYHINMTARNLRRGRTGAIVVLVPNLGNPFFSLILAGIEQAAAPAGFSVLIVDTKQTHAREEQIFTYLHNSRADGLISLDGKLWSALRGRELKALPPLIFACEWADDSSFNKVTIDNEAGAALAIQHLYSLGHRKIGHLQGPPGNVLSETRLSGTRAALCRFHIPMKEEWLFSGDFSLQSGVRAAREWLSLVDRPTALFCASDQMACGFISEIMAAGLSVPGDVSVVGFDDIDIARHFIPALTTIHQPRMEIGLAAARLLIEQIYRQREGKTLEDQTLPVKLIERQSTGPV